MPNLPVKHLLSRLLLVIFIIASYIALSKLISLATYPLVKPVNYPPTNISPTAVSFAWITQKPQHSCLLVTQQHFSLLQTFLLNNARFLPLGIRHCQSGTSKTHLIKITGLKPQHRYQIYPLDNFFSLAVNKIVFITPAVNSQPPALPNPAYGTILNSDKTPASDTLVTITNGKKLLSTVTNDQGNWSLDLGSFSREDKLILQAKTFDLSTIRYRLTLGQHQPVVTQILRQPLLLNQ